MLGFFRYTYVCYFEMLFIQAILPIVNIVQPGFEEHGRRSPELSLQARGVCDFNLPLGDVEAVDPASGSPVAGPLRLEFGDTEITASAAITVDSTSIVYTGYTNSNGNFVGAVRGLLYLLKIVLNLLFCLFQI